MCVRACGCVCFRRSRFCSLTDSRHYTSGCRTARSESREAERAAAVLEVSGAAEEGGRRRGEMDAQIALLETRLKQVSDRVCVG